MFVPTKDKAGKTNHWQTLEPTAGGRESLQLWILAGELTIIESFSHEINLTFWGRKQKLARMNYELNQNIDMKLELTQVGATNFKTQRLVCFSF